MAMKSLSLLLLDPRIPSYEPELVSESRSVNHSSASTARCADSRGRSQSARSVSRACRACQCQPE
eukprot:3108367-Rhodomonas_salina.3